jgi:hypothetical protein
MIRAWPKHSYKGKFYLFASPLRSRAEECGRVRKSAEECGRVAEAHLQGQVLLICQFTACAMRKSAEECERVRKRSEACRRVRKSLADELQKHDIIIYRLTL